MERMHFNLFFYGADIMSTFELAVQAQRERKFDLAIDYYQQIINEKGISVNLLQSIAQAFYLKKQHDLAVSFNLAAVHLSLHTFLENYKQGDPAAVNALQSLPETIVNQFPHPIGALLIHEKNIIRHVSHALLDQEVILEKAPNLRPYAEIYYAQIIDDYTVNGVLQQYSLTEKAVLEFEVEHYLGHGYQLLLNQIKWDQLDNTDVMNLYIN